VFSESFKTSLDPICKVNSEILKERILEKVKVSTAPTEMVKRVFSSYYVKAIAILSMCIISGFYGLVIYNTKQGADTKTDVAVIKEQLHSISSTNEAIKKDMTTLLKSKSQGN
jgi:hypothetical protein